MCVHIHTYVLQVYVMDDREAISQHQASVLRAVILNFPNAVTG